MAFLIVPSQVPSARLQLKIANNCVKPFQVLREAINRRGTDEGALSKVIATRAEVDLKLIKELYHKRNSVPLERAIVKDTHGDYEKLLLALIGDEDA